MIYYKKNLILDSSFPIRPMFYIFARGSKMLHPGSPYFIVHYSVGSYILIHPPVYPCVLFLSPDTL